MSILSGSNFSKGETKMEMQFDPGYGEAGMDAADFSALNETSSEANAEWDATLDTSFPETGTQWDTATDLDTTLDQGFPETPQADEPQPGDLNWQPSDTGVQYPPEQKEGNYGGPERLG